MPGTSPSRATRLASSHAVVAIAVPMAPERVRKKLINPAADTVSLGGMLPRPSAVSPMKKKGMPKPCNKWGIASVQ